VQYTSNYNLKKPEGTDIVNIDDLNHNADILDQKLKELEIGSVSKSGDTMTGPLRVGGLVIRDLNCITTTSPKWWKLVRIQAYDPNSGSETISFSGQVIVQSNYGRTADKQGIFTFSFGIRGISIKPVLFTAGDAAPKGNDTPRFQIWRDTDGWNYLYFQQPKYSKFCQFIYSYSGNNEYWTEEDPQQVSGLTLAWDSATDSVQDIYVGTKKVWHAGNLDPDAIKAGGVPIGAIIPWTTTTIPDGWLECNGQAVSRTGFSELFAKIGTTFGAGNGSTTFNIPDLRGEFIRGWDHGRGVDSGRAFGSGQADIFKVHNHVTDSRFDKLSARASDVDNQGTGKAFDAGTPEIEYRIGFMTDSLWASATMKTEGGPETRPRNVALMFIIKAKNVAGSDPAVQGANADTLDGFHASAFALSGHIHPEYALAGYSLQQNGYCKLANGLIIQWGKCDQANCITINFPIVFPNACLIAVASKGATTVISDQINAPTVNKFTNTSMIIRANDTGAVETYYVVWLAIGY